MDPRSLDPVSGVDIGTAGPSEHWVPETLPSAPGNTEEDGDPDNDKSPRANQSPSSCPADADTRHPRHSLDSTFPSPRSTRQVGMHKTDVHPQPQGLTPNVGHGAGAFPAGRLAGGRSGRFPVRTHTGPGVTDDSSCPYPGLRGRGTRKRRRWPSRVGPGLYVTTPGTEPTPGSTENSSRNSG